MSHPFARLWTASTCSGIAIWALPFVLGLGVSHGTWDEVLLGWLLGIRTVGFVIAVPLGGIFADRIRRSRVIMVSGLLASLSTVAIAVFITSQVQLACLFALFAGAGQGASRPTYQAMVQEVVSPQRRQQANAAMTLSVRVATLLGPLTTALASRFIGDIALLLATGGIWLAAGLLPVGLGAPRSAGGGQGTRPSLVGDFLEGIREARRHPWFIAGLGALAASMTFGFSVTGTVLPIVSRDRFGGDELLTVGATAYTAGALGGAILMSRWQADSPGRWAMTGLGAYALVPLSLALSHTEWPIILAYILGGIGIEVFNVPWFTAVQREVPPDKVARVSSLDFFVSYGLAPLGLALMVPAINAFGLMATLAFCTIICASTCVLASLPPSSRNFSASHGE